MDRESIQLILALRDQLRQHDIRIGTTSPDAYAQAVTSSRGINDTDLQALRIRLHDVEPPKV